MDTLDFILIHGWYITEQGELNPLLIDRLDQGLGLFREGKGKNIVIAGKYGLRDREYLERLGLTESHFMKEYLESQGVPPEFLLEEDQGENTFDCTINAYNHIIIPNNWNSGHIVSSREHLLRVILQTMKVMPQEMYLEFSGTAIKDKQVREEILSHETEAIKYTLDRKD